MPDRVLLRVMCSKARKAHVVGTVHRAPDGALELHYKDPMRIAATGHDAQDFEVLERVERATPGAVVGFEMFCASCKQRYDVPVHLVFDAASRGVRSFKLQGRNAEARWKANHPRVD
jgi:hypothetical protein